MPRRPFFAILLAPAVVALGVSSRGLAHHSDARFDRCRLVILTGEIDRVLWRNPHVELVLLSSEGPAYTVIWLNLQQLKRENVEPNALRVGDRIEVTGAKQPEDNSRVIGLVTAIRRSSDGWSWSRPRPSC
jgi:hypothetical protein